jgi:hypothetical protein
VTLEGSEKGLEVAMTPDTVEAALRVEDAP